MHGNKPGMMIRVKQTVSTLSTIRKVMLISTLLISISVPAFVVVKTFGPTVLGFMIAFTGGKEIFRDFQEHREYRKKLGEADKRLKALEADNRRLQSQKQKVIREIRKITVEVDRDVQRLEDVTGVKVRSSNLSVAYDGLSKPIPEDLPAKQNLAACKTALDGATKLAYDTSLKLERQQSLVGIAYKDIDNLKLQIGEWKGKLNAAELRVKQLRKRKFRHGPGVGLQFLNPANGFGIQVQPSFGYYLIWGR